MNLSFKKSVNVLNFFAMKEGGIINKAKAIKLIWLSDRLHGRKYGRKIMSDSKYIVMKSGIAASKIIDVIDNNITQEEIDYKNSFIEKVGDLEYKTVNGSDINVFSKSDIEILDIIYSTYGCFNESELFKIMKTFPEWKNNEPLLISNYVVEVNEEDFFLDPQNKEYYNVFDEDFEYLLAAKNLFEEHYFISNLFK